MLKRLLFFFLLSYSTCWAQTDTTVLYPAVTYHHTPLLFRSFVDVSGHPSIRIPADSAFAAPPHLKLMAGFTPYPVWLRFTLLPPAAASSAQPTRYMVQLTNWYLDEVDFYLPDGRGGYIVERAGDHLPFVHRPIQLRFPTFELVLRSGAPTTVYARIRSTQHINLALRLSTPSAFAQKQVSGDLTNFTLGLSVMRLLLHLALLLFLFKDLRFRAYNLLGLSVCLIYLISGGNSNVLFPASPFWANALFFIVSALIPVSFCYYVGTLYEVRKHFPRLVPLAWLVGLVCATYGVVHFFFNHAYLSQAFAGFFALVMVSLAALALVSQWRGIRPSIWYLTPLLMYLLMSVLYYAQNTQLYGQANGPLSVLLQQESLRALMLAEFLFMPFLVAIMLKKAYRERLEAKRQVEVNEIEQKKLETLDKLKTRFFTSLSHEFRTPLSLLLGPIDELRQRFPENAEYENMHRNAHRLLTLINQLLDMAKMDIGQLELNLQPGDLAADLRSWVALSESIAQNRGIALTLKQNETAWRARYDAEKLERVVTNLIANAFKFTNRGGTVNLETVFDLTGMTLRVSDNGMGIPPKNLPTAFDRFYQKPSNPDTSPVNTLYEGSGVGLALVRELVELQQGSIGIASLVGEGTTFTVWIPLEPVSHASAEADSPPAPQQPGKLSAIPGISSAANRPPHLPLSAQEQPKLLFVSPDPVLSASVRAIVSSAYMVREAADGQEGLAQAIVWTPDLIITDLTIPRLDGLDLCARLRQDSRTDHIPIIELTEPGIPQKRVEENGADEYLVKPVDPVILLVRLQHLQQQQEAVRLRLKQRLLDEAEPAEALVSGRHERRQQAFMASLYSHLDRHLAKVQFTEERLALEMAMDCQSLNRKLNALVGMNTSEVIRTYRLRRAVNLLRQGITPAETAHKVGFDSPLHFINAFRAYFQRSPSTFLEQQ